jgi:hypothetical protein
MKNADERHANEVRFRLHCLQAAIRQARDAGLTVELSLAAMVTLGDKRDTPFDPHTAVTISRET